MTSVRTNTKCTTYDQACNEARKWIEDATGQFFPYGDFRASLRNGVLLCKLAETISGTKVGDLNPIPRSLAWMDNLTVFLSVCRLIGLEKSQLFRVDDLAAVRNQDLPAKIKLKEENRKVRNVLITVFWLGKLAHSLGTYRGPLPDLKAFEILINKQKPLEMIDPKKIELSGVSPISVGDSSTWPRIKRKSEEPGDFTSNNECLRQHLIPLSNIKVKEKATMYDKWQQEDKRQSYVYGQVERPRSGASPFHDSKTNEDRFHQKTRRARSVGVLDLKNYDNRNTVNRIVNRGVKSGTSNESSANFEKNQTNSYQNRRNSAPVKPQQNVTVKYNNRSKRDDYVSVSALVHHFSNKDAKSTTSNSNEKANRRSLPADFNVHNKMATQANKHSPRSKSVYQDLYGHDRTKISASIPHVSSKNVSERVDNFTDERNVRPRRRSEPGQIISRNINEVAQGKAVGYPNAKNKNDKNRSHSSVKYISSFPVSPGKGRKVPADDMSRSAIHGGEPARVKTEFSHEHLSNRPVTHNLNYVDKRRKSEPVGLKYATMPARVMCYETEPKQTELANAGKDVRYQPEKKIEQKLPSQTSNLFQQELTVKRRLPTYQEAIQPLSSALANEELERGYNKSKQSNQTKPDIVKTPPDNKTIKQQPFNRRTPIERSSRGASDVEYHASVDDEYYGSSGQSSKSINSMKPVPHVGSSGEPSVVIPTTTKYSYPREYNSQLVYSEDNQFRPHKGQGMQAPPDTQQRVTSSSSSTGRVNVGEARNEASKFSVQNKPSGRGDGERRQVNTNTELVQDEDFRQKDASGKAPTVNRASLTKRSINTTNIVYDNELLELVAAEERYWKEKMNDRKEHGNENIKQSGMVNEKQKRVNEMLREYKQRDPGTAGPRIDYSEMTDTLRAEEEFFAQEAEKLLKERSKKMFLKDSAVIPRQMGTSQSDKGNVSRANYLSESKNNPENRQSYKYHAIPHAQNDSSYSLRTKPPSVSSSDDLNLKPEADQAYCNNPTSKISSSRSPVYICSGCRLPVEKNICLYVSELQSYWHEKCFCCSVCRTNLMRGRSTPKIRVMFSRIHCENCLSSSKSGHSTMV